MKKDNAYNQIVILGAGLAGLSAAYELSKAKRKVTVVEKWEEVGGLARTITKGKFKFDTGPHRWYSKNDMVNNWMLSVLGKETIQVPRLTRIYFDNKFFYYPIKLSNALLGIGPIKALRSVIDYFLARIYFRLTQKKPLTLEDGYIAQFGKTLYQTFFERYSEKLWGKKCSQISADWIGQRTRGFNITTVLKEALVKSKKTVSFIDQFSYPQKGIGRLSEKLLQGIKASQGSILLNSQVVEIRHDKRKITQVIIKQKGKKRILKADQFVSSIALSDLVFMLSPKPPSFILKINKKLTYRDEILIALFVNKTKITNDTWIYVHPFDISFIRFMEMDNWSNQLSPPGTTTLVFEIACNQNDRMWNSSDEQLIKLVSNNYLQEFKFIKKENILGGFVHRVPKQYPVYHLGYKKDVDSLKKYLQSFTNLQLIGRNGTFRYNNMDHSVETGLYAAWNIMTGEKKFDIEKVNLEKEYLEEKKLETKEDESIK